MLEAALPLFWPTWVVLAVSFLALSSSESLSSESYLVLEKLIFNSHTDESETGSWTFLEAAFFLSSSSFLVPLTNSCFLKGRFFSLFF